MPKSIVENIDCVEGMKQFPDKFFDLAIVDPPYGIGVSKMAYLQENKTTVKQKNGTRLKPRKTLYKKSDWDLEIPKEEYFNELFRVSKNQIIWGINYFSITNIGNGLIKWNKCIPDGLSFKKYEYAYCSLIDFEKEFTYLCSGFNIGINLDYPTTAQKNMKLVEQRIHPTQKPIMLYNWLLENYAKQGDKILDTHLGSQSSRIAAYKKGFDFWGFEIDKDYFDQGNERFEKSIAMPLFDSIRPQMQQLSLV